MKGFKGTKKCYAVPTCSARFDSGDEAVYFKKGKRYPAEVDYTIHMVTIKDEMGFERITCIGRPSAHLHHQGEFHVYLETKVTTTRELTGELK